MDDAAGRLALKFFTGHALHGLGAPVGAHIGKDGGRLGHQVSQEHGHAVEGVVFRGQHEGFADAVPVEGRIEDGLREVSVGIEVRPLALALEPAQDGVVAQGFLSEAHFLELGVALQEVLDDNGHLYHELPVLVFLFPGFLEVRAVAHILVLLAVLLGPGKRLLKLLMVVDAPFHAADNLHLVYAFAAHAQVVFEEVRVHDGTGDAHAHGADGQIRPAPQGGGGHGGAGKAEELFLHIGRDGLVVSVLDVMSVDAEGGEALLGVGGEDGGQIHGAGTLGPVEAPDGLDGMRVHVHGFAAVAPARGDGDGDGHTLAGEFLRAGGRFGHPADGTVGNDALYGSAVNVTEFAADEFGHGFRHAHGLVFQGFPDAVHAPVDGGADANFGVIHILSVFGYQLSALKLLKITKKCVPLTDICRK